MYTISTVHNPDRQNYVQKLANKIQYDVNG